LITGIAVAGVFSVCGADAPVPEAAGLGACRPADDGGGEVAGEEPVVMGFQ